MMKKLGLSMAAALAVTSSVSLAQVPSYVEVSPDLGIAAQLYVPGVGDYDLFDMGVGAEIQFRDWINYPWGYLLSIGYGEWSTDADAEKPGSNLYDFTGDMEVTPFGGSVLFQVFNEDSMSLTLEAGVRYMAVDSKVKARNSTFATTDRTDIDIDDGIVGRIGATFEYASSEDFLWTLGLAYQEDIQRGDVTFDGGSAVDNIMEAFVVEAAMRMPF